VLIELNTVADLDALLADPSPVLIYKHSLTCGTSGMALEEVRELLDGPPIGARAAIVLVQPAREVSNEIARRLGVRHESPQALIVSDNRVLWHASHFRVTAESIREALQRTTPEVRA
jgi:bacillithiol system protein YtxJ